LLYKAYAFLQCGIALVFYFIQFCISVKIALLHLKNMYAYLSIFFQNALIFLHIGVTCSAFEQLFFFRECNRPLFSKPTFYHALESRWMDSVKLHHLLVLINYPIFL